MKIGCISDLHIRENEYNTYANEIIKYCKNEEIDLLLIAGDIGENAEMTVQWIKHLNVMLNVKYVPGNHDLWNRSSGLTSEESYQLYLEDDNCLLNKSIDITDEFCIVGHVGWYDYSYGQNYNYSEFDLMSINHRKWNDIKYIDFEQSNFDICNKFNDEIEGLIKDSEKDIILMTHMISHPNFKVLYDSKRDNIDYFNAFLGSDKLHTLTLNEKVKYAISGHVHYRQSLVQDGCKYILPCLCSTNEWSNFNNYTDLPTQLKETIQLIEV